MNYHSALLKMYFYHFLREQWSSRTYWGVTPPSTLLSFKWEEGEEASLLELLLCCQRVFTVLVGALCLKHAWMPVVSHMWSCDDYDEEEKDEEEDTLQTPDQTVTVQQHFWQLLVVISCPIRERRPSVYSSAPRRFLVVCFCFFKSLHWIHQRKHFWFSY